LPPQFVPGFTTDLVFSDGDFEPFSEGAGLNQKLARAKLDFVVQQLTQRFDGKVLVWQSARAIIHS
jgi:hypothetical protein